MQESLGCSLKADICGGGLWPISSQRQGRVICACRVQGCRDIWDGNIEGLRRVALKLELGALNEWSHRGDRCGEKDTREVVAPKWLGRWTVIRAALVSSAPVSRPIFIMV